ncbi:MAG: RNA 2',3'-cyclic phosphodiesterase [Chromatiales bacterium]|jgi:2'-5' RNA ligase
MNEQSDELVRVFFALWPDARVREQIRHSAKKIQLASPTGRIIKPDNLHITLHFIGNINTEVLSCMRQQAKQVKAPRFELRLDRSGYFKKPGIVWIGCSHIPNNLMHLHQQLGKKLGLCEFHPERRKYQPHVTIRRKSAIPELPDKLPPIHWPVDQFALIRSNANPDGSVSYEVVENYPLANPTEFSAVPLPQTQA